MKLSEILLDLEITGQTGNVDVEVTGIQFDSRRVKPGDLFIAVPGFKEDGIRYLQDAVNRGAAAVVSEKDWTDGKTPAVTVKNARQSMALIARSYYGKPDEKLALFGITGTNGKTTTAHLVHAMLESSGKRASLLGTIHYYLPGRVIPAAHTTPEACDLQHWFREILQAGGDSVVMEVSSHALALHRVQGMRFESAVFTNLTHDHLDFHQTMEAYFEAKSRLFTESLRKGGHAIIHRDDPYGVRLVEKVKAERPDVRITTYGLTPESDVRPLEKEVSWKGIFMNVVTPWGMVQIASPLSGFFNVSNLLAAIAAALASGIPVDAVGKAAKTFRAVLGRFEKVEAGQPFTVLVDYAHTPDALERLLESARHLTAGRILLVFGCGGDRDRKKRPVMGKIAREQADAVFVTSDNPRTEDKDAIIREIMDGQPLPGRVTVEPDRARAIDLALQAALPDDCVVIAGKGHEDYQIIGTVKHPFDDRKVVREFFQKRTRQHEMQS